MRARRAALALSLALSLAGVACARRAAPSALPPSITLADVSGKPRDLRSETSAAPFTVVTFFSTHCPCQRAHDARLRELYDAYAPKGVRFVAIDAEVTATPAADAREAEVRRYPYPIYSDPRGASADALGAEYATYTVIVDRAGRVLYAGGIDSDRSHLTASPQRYLADALADVVAGRPVRTPRGETLGCALQR